jgi:hypothetical protein
MTNARRAAGRVNASLALYREAMERCMERRRKHEELLAVARLNAAAVVEASDGVYQIEKEDYQHRAIHLIGRDGRSDKRAPGADDMIVTDSGVTIDKHAGWGWTIPLSLAIHIVEWMAAHKFKTPEPPVCDCPVPFEEVGEGEVFMLDDTLSALITAKASPITGLALSFSPDDPLRLPENASNGRRLSRASTGWTTYRASLIGFQLARSTIA